MKPGTKSRKLGLQIPTVNPCNDFIVDYLIRNKIKSDKQVLTKSYLYNLAIEAVRKYPLPLICEEQLAALEGFGNFFIGQVGRLIKKHYTRGRLPTEKEMEEDDEAHFQALRAKKKPDEKQARLLSSGLERDLDSPVFGSSRPSGQDRNRRYYRPKRNTQPFHILQALVELKADNKAVTKGDINQVLYNHGKQKIRLWYVLRQKLQDYKFIEIDQKDEEYIYLTKAGRKYVQNYDKEEEARIRRGRRKVKIEEQQGSESEQGQEQGQGQGQGQEEHKESKDVSKKGEANLQGQQRQRQNKTVSKPKQTKIAKQPQPKSYKMISQMQIKKITFPKNYKLESIDVLVNQKDSDLSEKEALLQKCQDLSYEFCQIQVADFLWAVEGKILDYIAVRVKDSQFDQEEFKTILFRTKMTTCKTIFVILEQSISHSTSEEGVANSKQQETEYKSKEQRDSHMNFILRSALVSGFKIVRTKNLEETIKFVHKIALQIFKKLQQYESNFAQMPPKRPRKQKKPGSQEPPSTPSPCPQQIRYLGTLQKINKKLSYPYEISTITNECIKCIPEMSQRCQKILLDKFPTFATLYKKSQDSATTKEKKLFFKAQLLDEKINDNALGILVQILFYDVY